MVHLAIERFEGQGVITAEEGVMMLQAITAQDSQVTIGNDSIYCEEGYCYTTLLPPWHRRQAMIDLGKSPKICELFQYVTEKNIDVTNCKVDYSYWGNILHVWPAEFGGVTLVALKCLYRNDIRIGQGVITLGTCKIVSPRQWYMPTSVMLILLVVCMVLDIKLINILRAGSILNAVILSLVAIAIGLHLLFAFAIYCGGVLLRV